MNQYLNTYCIGDTAFHLRLRMPVRNHPQRGPFSQMQPIGSQFVAIPGPFSHVGLPRRNQQPDRQSRLEQLPGHFHLFINIVRPVSIQRQAAQSSTVLPLLQFDWFDGQSWHCRITPQNRFCRRVHQRLEANVSLQSWCYLAALSCISCWNSSVHPCNGKYSIIITRIRELFNSFILSNFNKVLLTIILYYNYNQIIYLQIIFPLPLRKFIHHLESCVIKSHTDMKSNDDWRIF